MGRTLQVFAHAQLEVVTYPEEAHSHTLLRGRGWSPRTARHCWRRQTCRGGRSVMARGAAHDVRDKAQAGRISWTTRRKPDRTRYGLGGRPGRGVARGGLGRAGDVAQERGDLKGGAACHQQGQAWTKVRWRWRFAEEPAGRGSEAGEVLQLSRAGTCQQELPKPRRHKETSSNSYLEPGVPDSA